MGLPVYVLFPNLTLDKPVELNGVPLEPVFLERRASEKNAAAGVTKQISPRQAESLAAVIVWAAYRAGEDITSGEFVRVDGLLIHAGKQHITSNAKKPVHLETLLAFMPEPSRLPEIAVFWFARSLQTDSKRSRLVSLYNALGSLPGGFDAIANLFNAEGEEKLGQELFREIAKLRAGDDETGPAIYTCGFNDEELKRIENIFVKKAV